MKSSEFKREIGKIWTEITSIHEKLGFFDKPKETDLNNIQLINTLQQRNQNICSEISMLKQKLLEETTKLKTISEERDSYRTALQILTKELHVAQPDTPGSNHGQADINFAKAAKRPRLNLH